LLQGLLRLQFEVRARSKLGRAAITGYWLTFTPEIQPV